MSSTGTKAGSNALKKTLEIRVEVRTPAEPRAIYETLVELRSHLEWGGNRAPENGRLLTIDAPTEPATVGTEWSSTGSDPMGSFDDRSVVIEAIPGRVFEFVTEGKQHQKRSGEFVDWTIVHRYEISPEGEGSRISYHARVTSISKLFGPMHLFNSPLVRIIIRMWEKGCRRGVENLATLTLERGRKSH